LHAALGIEEEQLIEVERRLREAYFIGAERPALKRRLPIEAAMRGVMALPSTRVSAEANHSDRYPPGRSEGAEGQ
jgi:hypothetical protein